jgi:hypothetical protein
MFENLNTSVDIQDEQDRLGGGGILESGVYAFTVDYAYGSIAASGAKALNLRLSNDAGQRVTQQLWLSSGTAKGGSNTYKDREGKDQYLPGFLLANSLCLLAGGKEISQMQVEEKTLMLYDFDAKKELPTKVNAVIDLFGKQIIAGVVKQIVDKNAKDASGNYVATGETREQNEIDKFFRARDGMTVAEIKGGATTADFKEAWAAKNTGKVRDKTTKGVAKGNPAGAAVAAKPAKSLFAD